MLPDEIKAIREKEISGGQATRIQVLDLCAEVLHFRACFQDIATDKHLADCPKAEFPTMSCHCHQIMALEALMPPERD